MISFETRYNEALGRRGWQYRAPGGQWSEPMTLAKLTVALQEEIKEPDEVAPRWSKPIDHKVRRRSTAAAQQLYEIKGGRVRKVTSGKKGDHLSKLLEELGLSKEDLIL